MMMLSEEEIRESNLLILDDIKFLKERFGFQEFSQEEEKNDEKVQASV